MTPHTKYLTPLNNYKSVNYIKNDKIMEFYRARINRFLNFSGLLPTM